MPAEPGSTEAGTGLRSAGRKMRRRIRAPALAVRTSPSGLRRSRLAADLFGRSLCDVFPCDRIVVGRAWSGARVLAGGAIVLSGLGDAEAFVLACVRRYRGGRDRSREAEREQARHRRLNRRLLLHECLLRGNENELNENDAKDGRFGPSGPLVAGARATLQHRATSALGATIQKSQMPLLLAHLPEIS